MIKEWKDIEVGDIFEDGSVCTAISPWEYKPCWILYTNNDQITVSDDHMIKGYIMDENEAITFPISAENRIALSCDDTWIAAVDIHDALEIGLSVIRHDGESIIKAEAINDGEPMKVRCITCDTGFYMINGFINHNTGGKETKEVADHFSQIDAVLKGYKASPTIQKMIEAPTTIEAREIMCNDLAKLYEDAHIKIDRFNLEMMAKKMTSYKRDAHGLRLVEDDEKCDISTLGSVGNHGNLFKYGELTSSYKYITTPRKQDGKNDAANWLIM